MKNRNILSTLPIMIFLMIFGCTQKIITEKTDMDHVEKQLNKLAQVTLSHDLSDLPETEVETIHLLVKASQIIDDLFLRQVKQDNPLILKELKKFTNSNDQIYLNYFKIMFGPWDRLDEDHPFINNEPRPKGVGYYPTDMTKDEFKTWIEQHPDDNKAFESGFTMIRRRKQDLIAIPYSKYFNKELNKLSKILIQASETTRDQTLKTFLKSRAEGLLTDNYYQSDKDWMDLSGDIEIVIGPYEVYEDKLFGYKTAFESFICVVNHEESEKQKEIGKYLNDMEKHLPIPDRHKNFDRGTYSPFKVVDLVYSAGDTKAGIQTTAFNLPNDERVREEKGSKKVILKNVMKAKFEKCWIPIVNTVLAQKTLGRVSFEGYFTHTLMHEVSHGLGPGNIIIDGRETTVNKELKELYAIVEECKADVLGVYMTQYLIDHGLFPKQLEKTLYASNLGGMFRSIRFGIDEAHGGGVLIQLNHYLDQGGCKIEKDGRFSVNDRKMKKAVHDLAHKILMIEANGDYKKAKELIIKYRVIRPEVQAVLDRLIHIPIDIRPIYPIEES